MNIQSPQKTRHIHYWSSHPHRNAVFWLRLFGQDEHKIRFVPDSESPDYIFCTEQIWTETSARKKFLELWSPSRIVIYFAGECIFPDMNLFDYAICFDRDLHLGDRCIRIPTIYFYKDDIFADLAVPFADSEFELSRKTRFCNFIYSNPQAAPRRDAIFHALSSYKRVDSLGPHLNNCGNRTSRHDTNWHFQAIEMKRPYKFSIACENARYPGYVSEKILSSFQSHTVPIYWGDPEIANDFNGKAFINANQMSDQEVVEEVRRIDNDDSIWLEMISQPVLTPEQNAKALQDYKLFRSWADNLFSMDLHELLRKPEGFWPRNYRKSFVCPPNKADRILARMIRHTTLMESSL